MSEINSASFPLYNARGIRVHFTVPFNDDGSDINAVIDMLLANGYTEGQPGVVEGGDKTEIRYVVRGQGTNKDGKPTDRIWMYAPWGDDDKGSQLTHYLDTPDDVAAFERASGLRVADMPVCKGNAAPRRESGDFERARREVSFSIIRRKEESDKSIAGYKWKLVQYVPSTPPPTETRYPAILNRDGKPTGAQPQPSANPTPPQPSPTEPTEQVSGASANGVKVLNGSDPAVFGELFPASAVNVVTPDALYARVAGLFNAKQHFTNWWAQHEESLLQRTTNEAEEYTRAWRWNWDKERCQALVDLGGDMFQMQTANIVEALSEANGKKISKFRDWDGGTVNHAYGAMLAWHAGYMLDEVARLGAEREVDDLSITLAAEYCTAYQAKHKEAS